jgi:hypothetical protein
MSTNTLLHKMNTHKLLDAIKAEFGLKNDSALVKFLGSRPPTISKIRAGKLPITPEFILLVHDMTDWEIKRIKSFL